MFSLIIFTKENYRALFNFDHLAMKSSSLCSLLDFSVDFRANRLNNRSLSRFPNLERRWICRFQMQSRTPRSVVLVAAVNVAARLTVTLAAARPRFLGTRASSIISVLRVPAAPMGLKTARVTCHKKTGSYGG